MKLVKFLIAYQAGALYNEGETAGFEDDVADDLIKRDIAVAAKAPKPAKADADAAAKEAAAAKDGSGN